MKLAVAHFLIARAACLLTLELSLTRGKTKLHKKGLQDVLSVCYHKFTSSLSSSCPVLSLSLLSLPLSLCLSSYSISLMCVCVCVVSLSICAYCFLLPAPLRKAKFVESPRLPQSELGSPTHTSTTARNTDLDTYCPGKFFFFFWPAHPSFHGVFICMFSGVNK